MVLLARLWQIRDMVASGCSCRLTMSSPTTARRKFRFVVSPGVRTTPCPITLRVIEEIEWASTRSTSWDHGHVHSSGDVVVDCYVLIPQAPREQAPQENEGYHGAEGTGPEHLQGPWRADRDASDAGSFTKSPPGLGAEADSCHNPEGYGGPAESQGSEGHKPFPESDGGPGKARGPEDPRCQTQRQQVELDKEQIAARIAEIQRELDMVRTREVAVSVMRHDGGEGFGGGDHAEYKACESDESVRDQRSTNELNEARRVAAHLVQVPLRSCLKPRSRTTQLHTWTTSTEDG
eukprot:TRINITY_DN1779_c0_g2_i1.p1 TRINITY_DN1779_c0_g2~~TRINITY_DN1779_c0_g2_i1.p1  ORF type:complete len:292 (-),score=25.18 TRINITY_DN1779_c0_g2_i1:522-1397(-)